MRDKRLTSPPTRHSSNLISFGQERRIAFLPEKIVVEDLVVN